MLLLPDKILTYIIQSCVFRNFIQADIILAASGKELFLSFRMIPFTCILLCPGRQYSPLYSMNISTPTRNARHWSDCARVYGVPSTSVYTATRSSASVELAESSLGTSASWLRRSSARQGLLYSDCNFQCSDSRTSNHVRSFWTAGNHCHRQRHLFR